MKQRITYAMGISIVLLTAALVANAYKANSDLEDRYNTIHDLTQTLAQKNSTIIDLRGKMMTNVQLEKEKNDKLSLELTEVKRKLEKERVDFLEQLEKKDRLLSNKPEKLSSNKEQASKGISYMATYYDANAASTGKSPGHPAYGITYSGRKVQAGVTIAVDPNVIPLGSWVEVVFPDGRVEKRRADDTGSKIKGKKIDIYVPDASEYGKHQVSVRVISTPEGM